jgi:hypothetical protein
MTPLEQFEAILAAQYQVLFEAPEYAMAAARHTPEGLAHKMTSGLAAGTANKDGEGIRNTCKLLGIPHTYKAIRSQLEREAV